MRGARRGLLLTPHPAKMSEYGFQRNKPLPEYRAQKVPAAKSKKPTPLIRGVDIFCGAGGLTKGLEISGIDMKLGIDVDPACAYPYETNNSASFLLKSVRDVTEKDFSDSFLNAPLKLLAGCAPCQTFSTYSQRWACPTDERWTLLREFSRLVRDTQPHLVTMENVPLLQRKNVFAEFVSTLESEGFHIFSSVIDCADYGVPQNRRRLVVLASKLGPIKLLPPTTPQNRHMTVKQAIGRAPRLEAGEICKKDFLHRSGALSPLNLERIRISRPGGTWREWKKNLRAPCHQKITGTSYTNVYGRMVWDKPSPTITTQYYGFGNGRFGHPEQDRALSLREGALLQSFPQDYKFAPPNTRISHSNVARLVGNAVPVKLGKVIGQSILRHAENWVGA